MDVRAFLDKPDVVIIPSIVLLIVFAIGLAIRSFVYRLLHRWAERSQTKLDDIIVRSTRIPSLLWCLIIAVHAAVGTSSLNPQTINYIGRVLGGLIVLSITLVLANIAAQIFRSYAQKVDLPATGLTQAIIKVAILAIGITVLLGVLGIDVTPIVAAFGVGGLAVALGLQDTLSNLFAGVHVLLEKPIKIGDYIKLESGEEGYVTDIGWRSTRIRMLPNNMVIVPNSKLVQSIITNYYLPQPELAVLVQVGVHYDSDLEKVERITCQVAEEILREVPGGVPEFKPFIRYHTFGDSSINFTVILRGREFADNFLIKHEFIKRLHARYREEGIVIPFPIRTLDIPADVLAQLQRLSGGSMR